MPLVNPKGASGMQRSQPRIEPVYGQTRSLVISERNASCLAGVVGAQVFGLCVSGFDGADDLFGGIEFHGGLLGIGW